MSESSTTNSDASDRQAPRMIPKLEGERIRIVLGEDAEVSEILG